MIALSCPRCHTSIEHIRLRCSRGHEFERRQGVVRLLTPEFAKRLAIIEETLTRYRHAIGRRIMDPLLYEDLPYALAEEDKEWAIRAADTRLVSEQLPKASQLEILDIGAWNGWLCHRLALGGHAVVGADYFADEFDGLAAQRHYSSRFLTIQLDLCDLSVIDHRFDVVIINHGLSFFPDPIMHVRNALALLRRGGSLFVLGLQFFRKPVRRRAAIETLSAQYEDRYGMPLFFRPTRGYLDWDDRRAMQALGLNFVSYRHLWQHNLLARANPTRAHYCTGVMQMPD